MLRNWKLLWQLYVPYLLITLLSLAILGGSTYRSIRSFYLDRAAENLEIRAKLLKLDLAPAMAGGDTSLAFNLCRLYSQKTDDRVTLLAGSGRVIFDSHENASVMDNHADRPEVQMALQGETGKSTRYSHTVDRDMMYLAFPLDSGRGTAGVLRVATPLSKLDRELASMAWRILVAGLVAALLATVVILAVSQRINRPLEKLKSGASRFAAGELKHKLALPDIPEIAALAETMNLMAERLDERIQTVINQRNEVEFLLSGMVEGVIYLDLESRIIRINRAAGWILDADSAGSQGRYIQEIVRNTSLLRFIEQLIADWRDRDQEIVLHQSDGNRILQVSGIILQQQGAAEGVMLVLHDISDLRKLENIRRDFVANVSHELKTPVTSIIGYVQTLLGGAMKDEQALERFLKTIDKQAERLQAIIEDLLDLSRIEREDYKAELALVPVKIKDMLGSVIQNLKASAGEKYIAIRLACPDDLSWNLYASLLDQAVANLIDNAVKYSEPGKEITVEARQESRELKISVIDRGCGIEPRHLPRLFERFYRVDKGRSRSKGGTGLGLAIVKHIVQLHHGRVDVSSAPGEGSTFTIIIPSA
ncbi:MAG: ATP-binding protein [Candidatus Glassbacteria bacterium]